MPLPRRLTVAAIGADATALALAVSLAVELRETDGPFTAGLRTPDLQIAFQALAVLMPTWLVIYVGRGLYGQEVLQHGTALASSVANAVTLAALLTLAGSQLAGMDRWLPTDLVILVWASVLFLTILFRIALLQVLRWYRHRRPWRVLIAGASQSGVRAATLLARRSDVYVAGFLDDYLPLGAAVTTNGRVLGRPADALEVAGALLVDELLVVEGALGCESDDRLWRDAYTTPGMPPLRLVPSPGGELLVRMRPAMRGRVPVLIPEQRRIGGASGWAKAGLDRSVALVVLLIAAPLLVVAALSALLQRRPFLTGADLIGRDGRRFRRWSLATGSADASTSSATMRLDSAVRADEIMLLVRKLPRALNVLRGDLSLVGPRPMEQEELPLYRDWTGVLLSMRPGLFGPWLLHRDSTLTPDEELASDIAYVRNFSLATDITILVQCCRRLLSRVFAGHRQYRGIRRASRRASANLDSEHIAALDVLDGNSRRRAPSDRA